MKEIDMLAGQVDTLEAMETLPLETAAELLSWKKTSNQKSSCETQPAVVAKCGAQQRENCQEKIHLSCQEEKWDHCVEVDWVEHGEGFGHFCKDHKADG